MNKRLVGWALLGVGVIGAALACFTQVSLISGTGTVWVGVAIATVALIACAVMKLGARFLIGLVVVVSLAFAAAIYDEVQLSHKRAEFNSLFDQ